MLSDVSGPLCSLSSYPQPGAVADSLDCSPPHTHTHPPSELTVWRITNSSRKGIGECNEEPTRDVKHDAQSIFQIGPSPESENETDTLSKLN